MNQKLAAQNDQFRQKLLNIPEKEGRCFITQGIDALEADEESKILLAVKNDENFTEYNDPEGDHAFGIIEIPGLPKVWWQIDLYEDENIEWGAEDPLKAFRVLTIMLPEER